MSHPIEDYQNFKDAMDAIERALELHQPDVFGDCITCHTVTLDADGNLECNHEEYPCATKRALDGEIGSVEPVKLEALDGEQ